MEKVDKKKSRKYTEEFRRQAVQLAIDLGSMTKAAKQLGVAHANLHNWKLKIQQSESIDKNLAQIKSEEELKRLRKENAELKKVNYILKAAAAVFSRDHQV
jgi:transposase